MDEIVGWHYQLNGHEFDWAPGLGDGQGSLVCCSPWDPKESGMTDWLDNNNNNIVFSETNKYKLWHLLTVDRSCKVEVVLP